MSIISTILAASLLLFTPQNVKIDEGGSVADRMQHFELIEKAGHQFKIDGMCISACTMFLGLKNVCVAPRTVFGFHSSYTSNGFISTPSKYGNAILTSYYPPAIRKWVTDNKALDSLELTPMLAEEAWALGMTRCPE